MASLTVTPLNNGITLDVLEVINGMVVLDQGGYVYTTNQGKVYLQADDVTPATLAFTATFAITCNAYFFDGFNHNFVFGGPAGNYVFGTIDITWVTTLTEFAEGTDNVTAATFDMVQYMFILATDVGSLFSVDPFTGIATPGSTLAHASLAVGEHIHVESLTHDVNSDTYLIVGTSTLNVAPPDVSNRTFVITGSFAALVYNVIEDKHLTFGAIGRIETAAPGVFDTYYVAAGETCNFYYLINNSEIWVAGVSDQAVALFSLAFRDWAFIAGLEFGILAISTNGKNWVSYFDGQLANNLTVVD